MFKKIFTRALNAEFWTSVLMELDGCPLPYLSDGENENEKIVNTKIEIGFEVAQEDPEKIPAEV